MKKTFLLLLAAMLLGMTFISCEDDDDGGSVVKKYTVTFKNGGTTVAEVKNILPGKTLIQTTSQSNEYASLNDCVPELAAVLSTTEYTVLEGWVDGAGNYLAADVPINSNITATAKFTAISEADAIAIDSDDVDIPAFDISLSHINANPVERLSGFKFFRITGDLSANHVYQIAYDYAVVKKGGTDPVAFRAVGIQASIDHYSNGVSWWNDPAVSSGHYSTKIVNKDEKTPVLIDKAFKILFDNPTTTGLVSGDEVTVTITNFTIEDLGEQVNATFNANGGTGEDVVITVNKGDSVAISNIPKFTKEGSYFKGWSTDASGSPQVDPFYNPLSADVTYYAIWVTEQWVKQLGTDMAQNIDLADYPDDAIIEFVFPKSEPYNDSFGAICQEWNGWLYINSPPTGTTGEYRVRYLIQTLKSIANDLSKPTLVNLVGNWKVAQDNASTAINLITFNGPAPVILTIGANSTYGYQALITDIPTMEKNKTYTLTYTFTLNKPVLTMQLFGQNTSWGATSDYYRLQDYSRVTPAPVEGLYTADTEYSDTFDMAITADGTARIALTTALMDGEAEASSDKAAKVVFATWSVVEKTE